MKKKGQFYLIAAIIIVLVIISLNTITNYTIKKRKPVKFYDLSQELNEEGARVVDYGIYNEKEVKKIIENFTDQYFLNYTREKEEAAELVFVYGNDNNATLTTYTSQATGTVIITTGSFTTTITGVNKYITYREEIGQVDEDIEVQILNVTYNFTLQEGENFFFIVTKKTDEETYITRN